MNNTATFLLMAALAAVGCEDTGGEQGETGDVTATSSGPGSGSESGTAAEESSTGGGIDADAIKAMADDFNTFVKVNVDPASSAHGNASTVNWWVPTEYEAALRAIDTEAPAATEFVEGALIVKEHLNGDGESNGYTMMYKGPPGTNGDANDWWFGRVSGNGELRENGNVAFCVNCHAVVEVSDYVYGVPADNQG